MHGQDGFRRQHNGKIIPTVHSTAKCSLNNSSEIHSFRLLANQTCLTYYWKQECIKGRCFSAAGEIIKNHNTYENRNEIAKADSRGRVFANLQHVCDKQTDHAKPALMIIYPLR